jgi:iron complex outermembrane receptor protein
LRCRVAAEPVPVFALADPALHARHGNIDVQVTQDPAVGMYVDGVYVARSTGLAFELGDVERIEVLRGPQGRCMGVTPRAVRSTSSTRSRAASWECGRKPALGNLGYERILGHLDLPAGRWAGHEFHGSVFESDGLVENTGEGKDFGAYERKGGRFAANWLVSEDFSAYFTYEHTDAWNTLFYYQAQNVQPDLKG